MLGSCINCTSALRYKQHRLPFLPFYPVVIRLLPPLGSAVLRDCDMVHGTSSACQDLSGVTRCRRGCLKACSATKQALDYSSEVLARVKRSVAGGLVYPRQSSTFLTFLGLSRAALPNDRRWFGQCGPYIRWLLSISRGCLSGCPVARSRLFGTGRMVW